MAEKKYTPMMQHYLKMKEENPDAILFYRLGDFYEMFFDDTKLVSQELDLVLTGRSAGVEEKVPMCGVPFHAAETYINRLIEKGYKVAICEQVEDPKTAKGMVKREVVRVVTPGTNLNTQALDETKNNYIMAIVYLSNRYGIAIADVTTGDFMVTEVEKSRTLLDEIYKFSPAEIICNESFYMSGVDLEELKNRLHICMNPLEGWYFDDELCVRTIKEHFHVSALEGLGLKDFACATIAAGALLTYLLETQKTPLDHLRAINDRLDAIEEINKREMDREEIREYLNPIYDLERLVGKISYQSANPRDLIAFKSSISMLPYIKGLIKEFKSEEMQSIYENMDDLQDLFELLNASIIEEPPLAMKEGGIIKDGYHEQVDNFRQAKTKGKTWLAELEASEREKTGIRTLKIKYNKVFGYYLEVTNSFKDMVPDYYTRKQTLTNAERYITPRLKELEDMILGAEDKLYALEYEIFSSIRNKIFQEVERVQRTAKAIARLDSYLSLALVASRNNYVRPKINTRGIIDIKNGRHPVVEQMIPNDMFIPNDTYLDNAKNRVSVITGPNMAGKSTYMRQTALIVLMAQIGSFVPAEKANIGIADRIFTRVGASDDLASGQSTFMVEMTEVANILRNATSKSLLILDEIGRGTSTFDGLSIAWAVIEYISNTKVLGAKTLFATHYHELTELEGKLSGVNNYCIAVKERGDDIVFLRKIVKGGADKSYGIQVAKLAGVPDVVIERAKELVEELSDADITATVKDIALERKKGKTKAKSQVHLDEVDLEQISLFDTVKDGDVLEELKNIDVSNLTPIDALNTIYKLQNKLKNRW